MRSEANKSNDGKHNRSLTEDLSKLYQQLYSKWRHCRLNWRPSIILELRRHTLGLYAFASQNGFNDISEIAKNFELRLRCLEKKAQFTPKDEQLLVNNLARLKRQILSLHNHSEILTLHPSAQMAPNNRSNMPNSQSEPQRPSKGAIGLLEVDSQLRDQISLALYNAGYTVTRFETVIQLQQAMQTPCFDLLLMGSSLTKESAATSKITEDFLARVSTQIPVIIVSDGIDITTRLTALRAGVKTYLTVPIRENEILTKIEGILSKSRQDRTRVLVIDDDKMLTKYYETTLEEAGFSVKAINDPLQSLQEIEHFKPDVITLDYHMPHCNGLEVAEILRGDPRHMNIPIIFMTASEEAKQHIELMRHYSKSVFEKPVDISTLSEAINNISEKTKKSIQRPDIKQDSQKNSNQKIETANKINSHVEESKPKQTLELSEKVSAALRSRAFELAFQPIVRPDGDEQIFEVLARLKDEDGELYTADTFIPFIEKEIEDGSYHLDRWVIENAFQTLEKTTGRGSAEFSIVIKLSPNLKQIERLLPFIYNIVSNSRLRGINRIYFSVPEKALAANTAQASHLIKALHTSGCGFVLEQCNASDKSIELINKVDKIEFIKLDRKTCNTNTDLKDTQRKIDKLRNALGDKGEIIAGVVEDAKTFAYYWQLDIRLFQGFFIHRPHPYMQYQSSDELFI